MDSNLISSEFDRSVKRTQNRPRERYNDKRLWHQITQKYLAEQHLRQLSLNPIEPIATSYQQDFQADLKPPLVDAKQFPLYRGDGGGCADTAVVGTGLFNGSVAITFWNCSDARRPTTTFKQYHPLTKPHGECLDEQFR